MELIKQLLASKKFIAMVITLICLTALKIFKVQLDPSTVAEFVAIISSYILGQGIADHGKEAARINAISTQLALTPSSMTSADKIETITKA